MSDLKRYFVLMESTNIVVNAGSMDIDQSELGSFICFYIDGVLITSVLDKDVQVVLCDGEAVYQTEGRRIYELQNAIE